MTTLNNNILFLISLYSPSIYRNLQLASKSFWLHIKGLSDDTREKIRASFRIKKKVYHEIDSWEEWTELPNGMYDGEFGRYVSRILVMRQNYRFGKLHGLYETFDNSGRAVYKCTYRFGKLHGLFRRFDNSGRERYKITYQNDVLHGPYESFKYYRKYGQHLLKIKNYINGVKSGPFRIYYEDGSLHSEGIINTYEKGKVFQPVLTLHQVSLPEFSDLCHQYGDLANPPRNN